MHEDFTTVHMTQHLRASFDSDTLKIGFIGTGRLATALAMSLETNGFRVHAAASRRMYAVADLVQRTRNCVIQDPQGVASSCDLIFVTTPDSLIQSVVEGVRWRKGSAVVHCSGATELSALAKAESDGADIGGFHPMQTFGDPETASRTLPGCVITIEANEELSALLSVVATALGCRVNKLPPGARGQYHAAAGYASQFINVLLAEATGIWASWGVSEEAALQGLLPVVRNTLSSIESAGLAKGCRDQFRGETLELCPST